MILPIPGLQQIVNYGGSKMKLTIIFEVTDDPDDTPESRACTEPLNIWFAFTNGRNLKLKPEDFHKERVVFVPGITKQTTLDARKFSFTSTDADRAYLYVLTEPAVEWHEHHESRQ